MDPHWCLQSVPTVLVVVHPTFVETDAVVSDPIDPWHTLNFLMHKLTLIYGLTIV